MAKVIASFTSDVFTSLVGDTNRIGSLGVTSSELISKYTSLNSEVVPTGNRISQNSCGRDIVSDQTKITGNAFVSMKFSDWLAGAKFYADAMKADIDGGGSASLYHTSMFLSFIGGRVDFFTQEARLPVINPGSSRLNYSIGVQFIPTVDFFATNRFNTTIANGVNTFQLVFPLDLVSGNTSGNTGVTINIIDSTTNGTVGTNTASINQTTGVATPGVDVTPTANRAYLVQAAFDIFPSNVYTFLNRTFRSTDYPIVAPLFVYGG